MKVPEHLCNFVTSETALQHTTTEWIRHFDEGSNDLVTIFLHFKRAFNIIDRNILLANLSYNGIVDKVLLVSNATNRMQITNVKSATNNLGVAEGSVLVPLLSSSSSIYHYLFQ